MTTNDNPPRVWRSRQIGYLERLADALLHKDGAQAVLAEADRHLDLLRAAREVGRG